MEKEELRKMLLEKEVAMNMITGSLEGLGRSVIHFQMEKGWL